MERTYCMDRIFYVYHHLNEVPEYGDTGCRYIGKGKGKRALSFSGRNCFWSYIFSKTNPPTVVLIAENLTEEEAFAIEIQQIAFAREHGVKLCNLTDGGDGSSGHLHTQEYKEKMSSFMSGRYISPETCQKIANSKKNISLKTREKLSIGAQNKPLESKKTKKRKSVSIRKYWKNKKDKIKAEVKTAMMLAISNTAQEIKKNALMALAVATKVQEAKASE